MRIVVFSDVHGNAFALKRFVEILSVIQSDLVVFLGDVFGYYYDQEKCLELLMAIPNMIWLKGNHDVMACRAYGNAEEQKKYIRLYGHSYDNLRERFSLDDFLFLANLPSSYITTIDSRKIGFFHGSPWDPLNGRIYCDTHIGMEDVKDYEVVFAGHTHCKIDRMVDSTRILSPGSLGQPRDGKGYGYLIYDTASDENVWENVDHDNAKLRREIDKRDIGLKKLYDVLEREERL